MSSSATRTAAIITVGSEIVDGIAVETNTSEIAAALTAAGYHVVEAVSVPDDHPPLIDAFKRLTSAHTLVVCTGGLGPTHDDITREATAEALGLPLNEQSDLRPRLEAIRDRHADPSAAGQVMTQALVLEGATVLEPDSGTAPGQIVPTPGGRLALLPGPPHEMGPMLTVLLAEETPEQRSVELSCVGISESDAQVRAQRVLASEDAAADGRLGLTVLAKPGLVRVIVTDCGAGLAALSAAGARVREALGETCFATDHSTLAETVITLARTLGRTIAVAESCTGGLIGAELTSVPGSSAAFVGGITTYADQTKHDLLGVNTDTLTDHGTVSAPVAEQMAAGALRSFGANLVVSVTGIAGPDGGTPDKPVGLVWFGIATETGTTSIRRDLFGDRDGIRRRATFVALDLLRRRLTDLDIS